MLAVLLMNRFSKLKAARAQAAKVCRTEAVPLEACRTCLSTDDLVSIFYSKEGKEKRTEDLRLATGLEITMDDGLSQKICRKCIKAMNTALQFRQTSKKAEKSLLKLVTDRKEKLAILQRIRPKLKSAKGQLKVEKVELNDYSYEIYGEEFQNDGEDYQDMADVKPKLNQKPQKATMILTKNGTYQCPTCKKEFRMKTTYKAHMRFHTNFCVCEACGKRCRNNNQLQEHKRARHGLYKIHKCAYCEYSSATKEALTIHERRHTGERPYVCDHCGATFHRRSNLVQHIAIHLPEKNFQCSICKKWEKSKKRLQVHEYKVHREKKYRYLCPICGDTFSRPGNARKHLVKCHRVPRELQAGIGRYICPRCPKLYRCPDHVRRHLLVKHDVPRAAQGPIEKFVAKL